MAAGQRNGEKDLGARALLGHHVAPTRLHDLAGHVLERDVIGGGERLVGVEEAVVGRHEHVRGAELADDELHEARDLLDGVRTGVKDLALGGRLVAGGVDGVVVDVDHVRLPHQLLALRAPHAVHEVVVRHGDARGMRAADDLLTLGAGRSLHAVNEHGERGLAARLAPLEQEGAVRQQRRHAALGDRGQRGLHGGQLGRALGLALEHVRELCRHLVA